MNNILFAKTHFKSIDKNLATEEIMKVDKKYWFWDPYRKTSMLSLMTKGAKTGPTGTALNLNGEWEWLPYTPDIIREWFEDEIFPWMGGKTRIMALKTLPNAKNDEHIDCDPEQVGTLQHKFRVVLLGRTGTLYYKTKSGNVHVPDIEEPFIMDGSWPHGMINDSDDIKLTIAAGAPWFGNKSYDNIDTLMKCSDYDMPDDLNPFFVSPELKRLMNLFKITG